MKTEFIKIDPENIELAKINKAVEVIKKGGIVAFPTETVYGLAADFFNRQAVEKIYAVKKRPKAKPLPVQIPDISYLEKLTCEIPDSAYQLISKFWPGPLTLVFKAKQELSDLLVSSEKRTIALRISSNKIARALARQSQTALVAPSANICAQPPAKTATEALEAFDGIIEMIIDDRTTHSGVASTVLDLTITPYKVLRQGSIHQKELAIV